MPSPRRAVFLDHQSLDLGDLDLSPLRSQFDELELFDATRPDQVSQRLQGAVAVVSNKVMLDAATWPPTRSSS
jgi:glycerate dehydrogenase